MDPFINVNARIVGRGYPVYIIAELSANHHRQYDEAVKLIEAAKEAGADAVKLQTFTPKSLTIESGRPEFLINGGTPWDGQTFYDLYKEVYTPWEWQPKLKKLADELGIDLFSSPFDKDAVDFLEGMGVPAYKIASFEMVDIPLIEYIAGKGKPIIMSTGLATLPEIEEAVTAIHQASPSQLALLKCNSAYPTPPEEMNLRTIPNLASVFEVVVGLSDHSLSTVPPVSAVSLGACIIEKHFTLSRSVAGPDSAFSLEPHEFQAMVEAVRTTEKVLGEARYEPGETEAKNRAFRRSLFVVKDIKAGEMFTEENVRSIRPGYGLHPRHLKDVLGRKAAKDIERGTPLNRDDIAEG